MIFATRLALVTHRVQLALVGVPHHVIPGKHGGGGGKQHWKPSQERSGMGVVP